MSAGKVDLSVPVLLLLLQLLLLQPLLIHAKDEGNAEGLGTDMCPECGLHDVSDPSVLAQSSSRDVSAANPQQRQLDRMEGMLRQIQDSVKSLHDRLEDASTPAKTITADKATKGRVVARRKPAWAEHIEFLSAVRVDAPVSSIHVLPQEGDDGLNKFVAVGDEAGHLYIFSISGVLLVDQQLDAGAVTAMVTVALRLNETLLVTGHSAGAVLAHRIWETSLSHDSGSLRLEHSHDFVPAAAKDREELHRPVWSLEMYRIGRARYLLVADDVGTLRLYRDNGTLHGSAVASSKPLVYLRTPSAQRVLFLSSHEATSLDLRTMKMKSTLCKGLDKSSIGAYTLDPVSRSKLYGVTDNGDLVYALVASDASQCLVRPRRKLELQGGPFKVHGRRGYILIATPRELSVLNTTHQRVEGLRTLFTVTMDEISQSFVAGPLAMPDQPLLACDRDRVIALGFGDGYVGFFKSNLPVQTTADWIGPRLGGVPVFFTILLLALAWYQFSKRKAATAAAAATTTAAAGPAMLQDYDPGTATTSLSSPFRRGGATDMGKARDKSELGGLEELPRRYRSPSRPATGLGSSPLNYRTNASSAEPFLTSLRNSTTTT